MFRIQLTYFVALAASFAAFGCGGGSGESVDSDAAESVQAAEPPAAQAAPPADYPLGTPRDDVGRFFGLYGDADNPDQLRGQFVVLEAKKPKFAEQAPDIPKGYLSLIGVWGDASGMTMKSTGDATFEHATLGSFPPSQEIAVEFELGPDGKAAALKFTKGFEEFGRRPRLGDVPTEWQ